MHVCRVGAVTLLTLALAACAPSTRQIGTSKSAKAPAVAKAESPKAAATARDRSGPKVVAPASERVVAYAGDQKPGTARDSTSGTRTAAPVASVSRDRVEVAAASDSASAGQSTPSTSARREALDDRPVATAPVARDRDGVADDRRIPWGLLGLLGLLGILRRRQAPRERVAVEAPRPVRPVLDRRVGIYERPG